jgi:hypothetical protein
MRIEIVLKSYQGQVLQSGKQSVIRLLTSICRRDNFNSGGGQAVAGDVPESLNGITSILVLVAYY